MSPQDDLFAAPDAAALPRDGRTGYAADEGDASAAPVDRTTIAYYAALQSYYRFGAWPEGVAQC